MPAGITRDKGVVYIYTGFSYDIGFRIKAGSISGLQFVQLFGNINML